MIYKYSFLRCGALQASQCEMGLTIAQQNNQVKVITSYRKIEKLWQKELNQNIWVWLPIHEVIQEQYPFDSTTQEYILLSTENIRHKEHKDDYLIK